MCIHVSVVGAVLTTEMWPRLRTFETTRSGGSFSTNYIKKIIKTDSVIYLHIWKQILALLHADLVIIHTTYNKPRRRY